MRPGRGLSRFELFTFSILISIIIKFNSFFDQLNYEIYFLIFFLNFLSKFLFLWENLDYFFLFWNQYRRFMISFDFRFD